MPVLRCLQCFRLSAEPLCRYCNAAIHLPLAEATQVDHDADFVEHLMGNADGDTLWDALCLALLFARSQARFDERVAEAAMGDLDAARQCALGAYMVRRLGDEGQAAAHFATARDMAQGGVSLGPAQFEFRDGDAACEVWLRKDDAEARIGVLQSHDIAWVRCDLHEVGLLVPHDWDNWLADLRSRREGALRLWAAFNGDRSATACDSGFRGRWKEFQLGLADARDRMNAPAEQVELGRIIEGREKNALRQLDVARTVSALVEAARNSVRECADRLRPAMQASDARGIFNRCFDEAGYDAVVRLGEEVRRESSTTHAELRKGLEYQGRLLRGSQEALNASLTELAKRANSLLWRLTPQSLLDDARDQLQLVVDRAREVAMIEQTDGYLNGVTQALEAACNDAMHELNARRQQLELLRRGYDRVARTLSLAPAGQVQTDDAARLRATLRDTPATLQGMMEAVERACAAEFEREAVLV